MNLLEKTKESHCLKLTSTMKKIHPLQIETTSQTILRIAVSILDQLFLVLIAW